MFVTDHSGGMITYIREGKRTAVPDSVLGTRLFETLSEAREKGVILDEEFEKSAAPVPMEGEHLPLEVEECLRRAIRWQKLIDDELYTFRPSPDDTEDGDTVFDKRAF